MKKLVLVLLLSPLLSHAGLRVIYGGGGYAEMLAWKALSQLSVLTAPLEIGRGNEGLQDRTLSARLGRWNRMGVFNTSRAKLYFLKEGELAVIDPATDLSDQVFLRLTDIYDEAGLPRPSTEITENVIVAWLTRPGAPAIHFEAALDEREVRRIAHEMVTQIQAEEKSLSGDGWVLHFLAWTKVGETFWNARTVWVGLELPGETLDLRSDIMMALSCPTAEYFGPRWLTAVEGAHLADGVVHARVKWNCGPRSYSGRMTMKPATYIDGTLVQVSQVEDVTTCADLLGK